ncbi:hypothetical protein A2U01_0091098, partial [Trifolium medium]|nr:hypothetical protein [Trifolium medium]
MEVLHLVDIYGWMPFYAFPAHYWIFFVGDSNLNQ